MYVFAAGRGLRLPGPGGAVRELDAAAGGDPGGAAVPALFAWPACCYTHRDVNIFVQIGLVVLVGLACKNAILIVEFAKQLHQEGQSVFEATLEASRLRLRPILMTSFAFIFGVVPLVHRLGGRGGDAPVAGDGRVQRHARRDVVRHLPDAGVLLRHPGLRRDAAVRRRPPCAGSAPRCWAACWGWRSAILLAQARGRLRCPGRSIVGALRRRRCSCWSPSSAIHGRSTGADA